MMLKEKLSLFLMEVKEMIKKDEILDLKVCEGLESNASWIPGAPCTLVAWWFIAMLIHSALTVFFSPFYSKKVVGPLVGWSWSSFEVNLLFLFCERLSMLKGYTGSSRGGSERSRQTTFPGKDSNLMGAGWPLPGEVAKPQRAWPPASPNSTVVEGTRFLRTLVGKQKE